MSAPLTCPDCGHAAGSITTTRLVSPWLEVAIQYWHRMKAEGFTDGDRLPDENSFGVIIRDHNGEITGMAVFHDTECDHAWLWLIYVEDGWRRHGHGLTLIREAEEFAKALWDKSLHLGTQGHNKAMQALAVKAGYAVDAIWYAKDGSRIAPPAVTSDGGDA
jgi:GNAT superfamily N-acetyltransferase